MLANRNYGKVLLILCVFYIHSLVAIASPYNWVQLSPANSPAPRFDASLAYDPIQGNLLLFGGNNGHFGHYDDTWVWNGSSWNQLNPTQRPPARAGASMAFDPISNRIILFGGYNGNYLNDTWAWDGTTWSQLNPTNSPSPRLLAGLALSPTTGVLILFGGQGPFTSNPNDTWEWNGSNWIQLSPVNNPGGRRSPYMASDFATGQLILFGGSTNAGFLGDTWNWNGTNWIQLSPANSPSPRTNGAMTFDGNLNQLLLFGGFDPTIPNDTWSWNGSDWTLLSTQTSPSGRNGDSLAFDFATSQLILFGGYARSGPVNDTWTFFPLPTVTSLSPSSGDTSGGTSVTITGTGFTNVLAVNFGSNPAQSFTVNSPTQITAISPISAPGTVDVTVTTSVGTSLPSAGSQFTYTKAPEFPRVTNVSPSSGDTSGGTTVTITGANFTDVLAVNFGSNPAESFTVDSPTQITAVSPPGSVGTVNVTVTTSAGTSTPSARSKFTYVAHPLIPTVTSLSPSSGQISGGTPVIITGTNFTNVSAVDFGSIPATSFTVNSSTQITAISPPGAALGTVNVTVTTSAGTSTPSAGSQFTYVPDILPLNPIITSVSPSSGPTSGGTTVIISGANFIIPLTDIRVISVVFGSKPAQSFTVDSATQITAVSPPGNGTVHIVVSTILGSSLLSPADEFTYTPAPPPPPPPPPIVVFPPEKFRGFQRANRFATQTDFVNILKWKAPSQGNRPVAYRIYRDEHLTQLIAIVPADHHHKFKFEDHNRKKDKRDFYFIVSVDQFGNISAPAIVNIKG
jgi:hypothetical protein